MHRPLLGVFLSFVSGVLVPLALAPWNIWPLSLVSLFIFGFVLFLVKRNAFFLAFAFNVGLFGFGAFWIHNASEGFGISVGLGWLLTALFVVFISSVFALPYLFLNLFRTRSSAVFCLLVIPGFWTINELFRAWVFTGFPWLNVGYGHVNGPLAGWAPIVGTFGVGYIIAFTASALVFLCTSWSMLRNTARVTLTGGTIAIWMASFPFSNIQWTAPVGPQLDAAILQDNLTHSERWKPENRGDILRDLKTLSKPHWEAADIIVWPEIAVPMVIADASVFTGEIEQLAQASNTTVITGILDFDAETFRGYNAILAVGEGSGLYRKQHLVPFGEYVPFARYTRKLLAFMDLRMSITHPGEGAVMPMHAGNVRIGALICYEIAYLNLVADVAEGTNLLVVVSNDSWLGRFIGPEQHMQIAQMRALETGRSLVRAATSGLSGFVSEKGRLVAVAPQFERVSEAGKVQPREGATPLMKVRNTPLYIIIFASLLFALLYKKWGR